jgi:hypothetical protein
MAHPGISIPSSLPRDRSLRRSEDIAKMGGEGHRNRASTEIDRDRETAGKFQPVILIMGMRFQFASCPRFAG